MIIAKIKTLKFPEKPFFHLLQYFLKFYQIILLASILEEIIHQKKSASGVSMSNFYMILLADLSNSLK